MSRVERIADEPAFGDSLALIDPSLRRKLRQVVRTDMPREKVTFPADVAPTKAIRYFYQVRSNVTHRGKEEPLDWDLLHTTAGELLRIFRVVKGAAESASQWPPTSDDLRHHPPQSAGFDNEGFRRA